MNIDALDFQWLLQWSELEENSKKFLDFFQSSAWSWKIGSENFSSPVSPTAEGMNQKFFDSQNSYELL